MQILHILKQLLHILQVERYAILRNGVAKLRYLSNLTGTVTCQILFKVPIRFVVVESDSFCTAECCQNLHDIFLLTGRQ